VGGVLLVASLYTMLWGKMKEGETDGGGTAGDVEKDGHKKSAECYHEDQQDQTTTEVKEPAPVVK
jgi:hypothetical protein